jgi:hypothetical protein
MTTITIESVNAVSAEICEYQIRRGGTILGKFDYYLDGASTEKLVDLAYQTLKPTQMDDTSSI